MTRFLDSMRGLSEPEQPAGGSAAPFGLERGLIVIALAVVLIYMKSAPFG